MMGSEHDPGRAIQLACWGIMIVHRHIAVLVALDVGPARGERGRAKAAQAA